MDSGCEEIVISKEFAQKIYLKGEKTNLKAELWDGTLVKMNSSSENLELFIGQAKFEILPYIVDWIFHDLILGKNWLTIVNSFR